MQGVAIGRALVRRACVYLMTSRYPRFDAKLRAECASSIKQDPARARRTTSSTSRR